MSVSPTRYLRLLALVWAIWFLAAVGSAALPIRQGETPPLRPETVLPDR